MPTWVRTQCEYRIESFARSHRNVESNAKARIRLKSSSKYLWLLRHQLPVVICIAWMFDRFDCVISGGNLSNACNNRFDIGSNWCFHQMRQTTMTTTSDTVGISAILVKSTLGGKLIDSEAEYLLMMVIERHQQRLHYFQSNGEHTTLPIYRKRCWSVESVWCSTHTPDSSSSHFNEYKQYKRREMRKMNANKKSNAMKIRIQNSIWPAPRTHQNK